MLKYVDTLVTFSEVPDEITLCLNISNCPCHCKNCHSSYLAEDIGEGLTLDKIYSSVEINSGTEYMIADETGNINYYPKDNFKRLNILY